MAVICVPRLSSLFDVYEEEETKRYQQARSEFVLKPCYQNPADFGVMPGDPSLEISDERKRYDLQNSSVSDIFEDRETTMSGTEIYHSMHHMIYYQFGYKPKSFQKMFLKPIMRVLAEYVIGPEWKNVASYYMKLYGWSYTSSVVFGVAPRRFGKTVVVSLVQLAVSLCIQTRVVTLSTGLRASNGMRDVVIQCLEQSEYWAQLRSGTRSEEILIATLYQPGRNSSLRFLPGNERIAHLSQSQSTVL